MEKEKSDSILLEQFLSGDEQAFTELVTRYQRYVMNVVCSLAGNSQDADDIAQEVFIRVYRNADSFRRQSKFSTWLYRIVINTSYTYLKRKKKFIPLDEIGPRPVLGQVPQEGIQDKDKQVLVRKVIERLPFKYRTVIVLKEIEGLSYEDIALSVGCSIGTVESRLFRARQLLKKLLSPLLEKEGDL